MRRPNADAASRGMVREALSRPGRFRVEVTSPVGTTSVGDAGDWAGAVGTAARCVGGGLIPPDGAAHFAADTPGWRCEAGASIYGTAVGGWSISIRAEG